MSQKETVLSKVKIGVIISLTVIIVTSGFTGLYKIYNAVTNILPNELNEVKRISNSTNIDFRTYKIEHAQSHSEMNKRIDNNRDDSGEKFQAVTEYFIELKTMLKTNWNFKELLKYNYDKSAKLTQK